MALCPPDGKIQMERSVVHREMIIKFTTRERCQIEGSGKHSPLFNRSVGKEQEQPCKPPPRLPPSAQLADAPRPTPAAVFYWVGENLSLHTSSLLGLLPDASVHIRPGAFMMGPSLWLLQTELEDQKEIVVAVEGKSLRAYRTRSSCDFIGNKDVLCQGATKSREQNWQKGLSSKYLGYAH
ncbi:uncharacterized protein M6G45_005337 isoform 1-T3 [Spheniscus humboldti]